MFTFSDSNARVQIEFLGASFMRIPIAWQMRSSVSSPSLRNCFTGFGRNPPSRHRGNAARNADLSSSRERVFRRHSHRK
jgi:hypothetical protein